MRNARSALAIVLLLIAQLFCVLPGQGQPMVTPGITVSPREVTAVASPGDSVGTIDLMNSQVETGPPDNLHFLEGQQDFYNGDGVRVTAGGKGKLTLEDGSFLTLFNETEIGGVNVLTSPPETDLFLQNGGFLGHVPPGQPTTVTMPNGAKITILGTYFFVVFNRETQVATAGNFDGLVNYTPPGGTEQELPRGYMVNLPAGGEVVLMELPFTHEQLEATIDSSGTPTAGLNALVQEYQIEPLTVEPLPVETSPVVAIEGQEIARTSQASVNFAAFSPDGTHVVSGGCEERSFSCDLGGVRVWDAFTGNVVTRVTDEFPVGKVAFSPTGTHVAGIIRDAAIVWDAFTGDEVNRVVHENPVNDIAFSPDGNYVVSGSSDNTVRVWETLTGGEIARMPHDDTVVAVAFSPDGQYVWSGSADDTARLWEVTTSSEVTRLTQTAIDPIAFSPDGRYAAAGGCDDGGQFCVRGTARVLDVSTRSEIAGITHEGWVLSVAFSPDSKYIVSGSSGEGGDSPAGTVTGSILISEAATGNVLARIELDNWARTVAFSPDGKYVVSGTDGGAVQVWDAITGNEVAYMQHEERVNSVAFSPDGRYLVSSSADGTARVWLWQPTCQVGC